jgi:hypothetical protein
VHIRCRGEDKDFEIQRRGCRKNVPTGDALIGGVLEIVRTLALVRANDLSGSHNARTLKHACVKDDFEF